MPDEQTPAPACPEPSPVERLRTQVPDLWETLAPMCRPAERDEADELARRLRGYLQDDERHADHAGELGNELLALHAGWSHYEPGERAALVGAMTYLLTSEDACPDHAPGGLADDDRVVRACVRTLLRRAPTLAE